jgi:hypothetical protein
VVELASGSGRPENHRYAVEPVRGSPGVGGCAPPRVTRVRRRRRPS